MYVCVYCFSYKIYDIIVFRVKGVENLPLIIIVGITNNTVNSFYISSLNRPVDRTLSQGFLKKFSDGLRSFSKTESQ